MSRNFVDRLEEGAIAFLLGVMTLITFVQVIMRYVFNDSILWGIEASTYVFGWLVLIGISYGVKAGSHIGVDALVNVLPGRASRSPASSPDCSASSTRCSCSSAAGTTGRWSTRSA